MELGQALKAVTEIRKSKDIIDIACSLVFNPELHEELRNSKKVLEQKENDIIEEMNKEYSKYYS